MTITIKTKHANSKHLTYPHAAYFGCTFLEVCLIALCYLIFDIITALLLMLIWGQFFINFIAAFSLSYLFVRLTAKKIGSYKKGKQAGYLVLMTRQCLSIYLGFKSPFVQREGIWSTRRRVS